MKVNVMVFVLIVLSCSVLFGQETWVKTFGGTKDDLCHSITSTPDGGFILTGDFGSNDGDFKGMNKGGQDIFVIKLDSRGIVQWKKTFGGTGWDGGGSITTTPDGGFVLIGFAYPNDGDFTGMNKGVGNIFVIKLNSRGEVEWKKVFGGSGYDVGYSITTTPDGGITLTGTFSSNDGDFEGMNKGIVDILVINLDSRGDVQWKKSFGGTYEDYGHTITTTPDGGYVLSGTTSSNDGDFKGLNKGGRDILVIKLNSRGDVEWKKTFGGTGWDDGGESITTTPDGGYVLSGTTFSNDGDFKGLNKGGNDILVIRLNSRGDFEWKKTFGSSRGDYSNSITTTPDGGCILTGYFGSNDGDFTGMNKGDRDIFVIKLDSNGYLQPKGKKSKKK
jgi:hypothetical protein